MNAPKGPADRIQRAKEELDAGAVDYAQASALIAIAELLQAHAPTPVSIQTCPECAEVSFGSAT